MIGIIMPIFNSEKYLSKCLESIFNQTYNDFFLICINDGSKDGSQDILDGYCNHHRDKMYIINQDNNGPSAARNAGLDYVETIQEIDSVVFIDSDDYIDQNYLFTMNNLLNHNKVDIVSASYNRLIVKQGLYSMSQITIMQELDSYDAVKLIIEDKKIVSVPHCKIFRKELWKSIRFPLDIKVMEDRATIFKVFHNANNILLTDYCGYFYRKNSGSITSNYMFTNKGVLDCFRGYYEAVKFGYNNYNSIQKKTIKSIATQAFAFTYLKMYTRFNKKSANYELRNNFNCFKSLVKKEKIIKKYKPVSYKNKARKFIYLFVNPLYVAIFRSIDYKKLR